MKKIIKKIIAFSLIFATLLTVFSCGKSNTRSWNVAGLDFTLPSSMTKLAAKDYGVYENAADGTKVYVYYYPESEVAEELGAGASVKAFADSYVKKNRIEPIDEVYDEKKNTLLLKYEEADGEAKLFSCDYFLRSTTTVYHVRMVCKSELRSEYEKSFKKWTKKMTVSDDLAYYTESGLNFALPAYMEKITVPYADLCFANRGDNTQFFVYFYSREGLLTDLFISMDSTVKEYADWFVQENEYSNVWEDYDEEAKRIILKYIFEEENTFYCDTVLRNDVSLIHVTMCCDAEKREIYEPVFDKWIKELSLVY